MKSALDRAPYCHHCNRLVALCNNGRCTNTGCGKLLNEPVTLNARVSEKKGVNFVRVKREYRPELDDVEGR